MCCGLYVDLPGLPRQQKSTLPGTHYAYIFSAYKNAYKILFLFIKSTSDFIERAQFFSLKKVLC